MTLKSVRRERLVLGRTASLCRKELNGLVMRRAVCERGNEIRFGNWVQPRRIVVSGARDSRNSAPRRQRMPPDNPVRRTVDFRCDRCSLANLKVPVETKDMSDARPTRCLRPGQTAGRRTLMALTGLYIQVRWTAWREDG